MKTILLISLTAVSLNCTAQTGWTLWASGLPPAHFAKLAVAPNHDIFYGGTQTVIYKANTAAASGSFSAMPAVPVPATVQNNVETLVCGAGNEPVAGYFRTSSADPFLFKFDNATNQWKTSVVDVLPTLGAFCSAKAPNGDLWVGAKWGFIYKSTGITDADDGTDNGSLAVDGNKVYMASVYGNVWMYDAGSPLGMETLASAKPRRVVFPNPATSSISINNISGPTQIKVYDMSGKLLQQTEATGNTTIDISLLPAGIYPVLTEDEHGKEYNKVVVLK